MPVNFILDEHPNSGLILDFNKKISVTRSRAISVSVIFQNLAQMKNRLPLFPDSRFLSNTKSRI